jgi:Ca-activated chloride channel family protein
VFRAIGAWWDSLGGYAWGELAFLYPLWFLALLVPLAAAFINGRRGPRLALTVSSIQPLLSVGRRTREHIGGVAPYVRLVGFVLLVAALARPVVPRGEVPEEREGIDIMLVLDFSGSMAFEDFTWEGREVSRKEALARVVDRFLEDRENDRFGIVGFTQLPNLISPLTLDYDWIRACLEGIPAEGGTAVGEGIVMAVKRLRDHPERQKAMILVSDGLSNRGYSPMDAAEFAREEGIRIHTIRIFPDPVDPEELERELMPRISAHTHGQFYQAHDTTMLQDVYRQIDTLEKSRLPQRRFQDNRELYALALWPGLLLILGEGLVRPLAGRRLP